MNYLPIPLAINCWENNFWKNKKEVETIDNIAWINYDNFVISCFGLGSNDGSENRILINELFFTNFETKSHIICKTPEMKFNIYENKLKFCECHRYTSTNN